MYWKAGSNRITAPTIMCYTIGQVHDLRLTLVTEEGDKLTNGYLFVANSSEASLIKAKLASESQYKEIRGAFDGNCLLGHIGAGRETPIDFRVQFPEGTAEGYWIISILVGHNDGTEQAAASLWLMTWPDLWHESWQELWGAD